MPPRAKTPRRSALVNLVLIGVGFTLLSVAVWSNREKLREVFANPVDYRLFGLAFLVYMTALTATFARWFALVRALSLPFRFVDAVRLGLIGNVFNLVIPGAVGGDVIKAVFLARAQPGRKASAVASMVIDRLLGLAGLFLLAGVAGLFALPQANPQVRTLIALVWGLLFVGLGGLTALFMPWFYPRLDRLVSGRAGLAKVVGELESAATAYRSKARLIVGILFASSLIHSLYVVAFYTVSRAIFREIPTFSEHFLIVPLVLFTTAVPLPFGALGLTEVASGMLFALGRAPLAAAASQGAVAMMAFRVVMYASGLVGLVVYLANLATVRNLAEAEIEAQPEPEGAISA